MDPGPTPHVRLYGGRYTLSMKRNLTETIGIVLTIALAALLCTPPANASKPKKAVKSKASPEAQRLMSAGLANLENGETSAAISTFNKAVRKEGSVSTYFLLGWAHYQRGFKLGSTEAADRDDAH